MTNIKLALRTLAKTPFVTAVAVLSLALGIGANAAIFSLFDQLLLSSLPVQEPDRLVNLSAPGPKPGSQSCNQAGECEDVFSYAMYRDLEREQTALAGIAAHRLFSANLAYGEQTVSGEGALVSGSYFPVLGVRPALGRLLTPEDDRVPGEHHVAVLSHGFWEDQLGADPGVLNSTIAINGRPMTVVGVTARGFRGTTLGARPDVFVPLTMRGVVQTGDAGFENRRSYWAYVFGRLRPGGTVEQARAELNSIYRPIIREVEAPLQEGMTEQRMQEFLSKEISVEADSRGQSIVHSQARTPLTMLLGITAIVLLIACANIANLLLARGAGRAREMAIRGSIGGSRRQLMTQLLTESLLLAAIGGLASLLVAHWTLNLIGSLLPPDAAATVTLRLDPAVLAFVAAVTLGTGLLFGMYPSLNSSRPDLLTALKGDAGQPSGGRSTQRFRTTLVTAQIALSMALLVAAGLFIRSLVNVSRVDLGLEADNLITFAIAPERNGYEPEDSKALFARLEEELAALPGVNGVTASMIAVLAGDNWGTDVRVQGFQSGPGIDSNARLNWVAPDYFRTMGIPLIAGREFTVSDDDGAPKVAIVNEAFVEKFGLDPTMAVGSFMGWEGPDSGLNAEIVGVVQDAKYSEVKDDVPPMFFAPYRQEGAGGLTFYVRTAGDTGPILRAIPEVVSRLDANLPVQDLKTLQQQVRENIYMDRMISTLSAAFAALATLLAAIGLYGVLAYTVAQRTREIGVRMALGAGRDKVRNMVLRQVGGMLVVGGAIGILAALGLGRAAASLLFNLEGSDPAVVVAAMIMLSLVALGAAYIPALRASKVEPMQALRYE